MNNTKSIVTKLILLISFFFLYFDMGHDGGDFAGSILLYSLTTGMNSIFSEAGIIPLILSIGVLMYFLSIFIKNKVLAGIGLIILTFFALISFILGILNTTSGKFLGLITSTIFLTLVALIIVRRKYISKN